MAAPYTRPDNTTQSASAYKANLDAAAQVFERIAAAFAPRAQSTPDMTVRVDAGWVISGTTLTEVAAQNSATITAPSGSNKRIDRVVRDASTGTISVITGTPTTGTPSAPAITTGNLPVCQVGTTASPLLSSTTAITNSMIVDERVIGGSGGDGWTYTAEKTTTGGTALDWTGIPAGVDDIEIMVYEASTSSNANWITQIGDSGGLENTGYNSATQGVGTSTVTSTSGFILTPSDVNASSVFRGVISLRRVVSGGNKWSCEGALWNSNSNTLPTHIGSKTLSAELDRVSLTNTSTDTFDGTLSVVLRYR